MHGPKFRIQLRSYSITEEQKAKNSHNEPGRKNKFTMPASAPPLKSPQLSAERDCLSLWLLPQGESGVCLQHTRTLEELPKRPASGSPHFECWGNAHSSNIWRKLRTKGKEGEFTIVGMALWDGEKVCNTETSPPRKNGAGWSVHPTSRCFSALHEGNGIGDLLWPTWICKIRRRNTTLRLLPHGGEKRVECIWPHKTFEKHLESQARMTGEDRSLLKPACKEWDR